PIMLFREEQRSPGPQEAPAALSGGGTMEPSDTPSRCSGPAVGHSDGRCPNFLSGRQRRYHSPSCAARARSLRRRTPQIRLLNLTRGGAWRAGHPAAQRAARLARELHDQRCDACRPRWNYARLLNYCRRGVGDLEVLERQVPVRILLETPVPAVAELMFNRSE